MEIMLMQYYGMHRWQQQALLQPEDWHFVLHNIQAFTADSYTLPTYYFVLQRS